MPPSAPKFASKMPAPLVAEIRKAVENESGSPTGLSPEWLAYRSASAQVDRASKSADRTSALANRMAETKRFWMNASTEQNKRVQEEAGKWFNQQNIQAQSRRLGVRQNAAQQADTRFTFAKYANLAAQEEVRRRSAELSQAANRLGPAAIQSNSAANASLDLLPEQIEAYRSSGGVEALWPATTFTTLRLQVRTTLLVLDPGGQQLAKLFGDWDLLYSDLLDATVLAYGELQRVAGKYVKDVDARRALYINIATGLLGAGLSLIGAQKVADILGEAVKIILVKFEGGNFDAVIEAASDLASAAADKAADEITDGITGDIADQVEMKMNNVGLPDIRRKIEAGGPSLDVQPFLTALKYAIHESLEKLRDAVRDALNGLQVEDKEISSLLRVMMRRHGLAMVLQTPTAHIQAIRHKHNEVYEAALQFYDSRAALILNELFAMYECRVRKNVSRAGQLRPVMERWVFAQYIDSLNDDQLRDMANATTGLVIKNESALIEKLAVLGVLSRRSERGGLDDERKARAMNAAQAGAAFTVGAGEVGDTSRKLMRAWAKSILAKTPLEYALAL